MKLSIRFKLFAWVSSLIVFFVFFSWILNSYFLDDYYVHQKKSILLESFGQINTRLKDKPFEYSIELEKIERMQNIYILILDSNFEPVYDSAKLKGNRPPIPNRKAGDALLTARLDEVFGGKTVIEITRDPRLNLNIINLVSRLENGGYILLSTPLAAVWESAGIANQFLMYVGILTMLLGGLLVFIFSKKFTQPILELNEIAQSMSKLDFHKKCTIKAQDEIGELSNSINSLSDQLDKSISELKEANAKLQEDIDRERQIDKMRKSFISSVSHELKTPISLIHGYAIGLKVNVNEDEAGKDFYCDVIIDETSKMDKLVKDLLELSQIESGSLKLEKAEFDLSVFLKDIMEKYRPLLEEKDIMLKANISEALWVKADRMRIEQVVTNFINNAVNHADFEKEIVIEAEESDGRIRTSVYNSGKCIPEDSMDKLWESFYKADKARTRAYGGAGLGLSIVKNIMDLHGGKYGVENLSDGVRFWFELSGASYMSKTSRS